jgi:site-specific recombinase XerD
MALETHRRNTALLNDFLAWLRARRSSSTHSGYAFGLSVLMRWLEQKEIALEKMALRDHADFVIDLEKRGLKSGTRIAYMNGVKCFWKWLFDDGLVPYSPDKIALPRNSDTKHHALLTPEEYRAFMSAIPTYDAIGIRNLCVFSLLWETGTRICELLSIDVSDIDLRKRSIVIKSAKRLDHTRTVFWEFEETHSHLIRWLYVREQEMSHHGTRPVALFVNLASREPGRRIDKHPIEKSCRLYRQMAKIEKKITPHSFRHGFATDLLLKGADIRLVQELLGHVRLSSTQIYTHVQSSDIEKAYRTARSVRSESIQGAGMFNPFAHHGVEDGSRVIGYWEDPKIQPKDGLVL